MARKTLLSNPDFNKSFETHGDSGDFQLAMVIIQEVKPISFYSKTLTVSQKRYLVTEK